MGREGGGCAGRVELSGPLVGLTGQEAGRLSEARALSPVVETVLYLYKFFVCKSYRSVGC